MANSLLKQLEREINKITNGESMTVDKIIENLKKVKQYRNASIKVLKTNIKRIIKSQNGIDLEKPSKPDELKSLTEKANIFDLPSPIKLQNLGGLEKIKKEIKQFIKINIKNKDLYKQLGFKRPRKNMLIKGPEGIGKTSLALAIVNEIGYNHIKLNLFDGRISSSLNDNKMSVFLLNLVKNSPCSIILDDLDVFFKSSSGNAKDNNRKVIRKLLDFFDYTVDLDVFVIGTVNKIENLNNDFLREGRFDKIIEMGIPGEEERKKILMKLLEDKNCDEDVNLKQIVELASGFVASDLTSLIYKTAEISIKEFINNKKVLKLKNDYFLEAIKTINPIIKKDGFTTIPETSFSDIGALENLKKELENLILNPMQNPEICNKFNITRKAGILLYGPPGCGKTMLAKAVANACKANFIYVKGPELLSKYFGESEKAVRGLFERARLSSPCLIFFDEIDGLCPKRSTDGNQVIERVVNQLLTELNGIGDLNQIYIIGATNRPDIIDKAILRPERLGVHLYVPLPGKEDRIKILQTIFKKRPIDQNVDVGSFNEIFDLTNFSGADLNGFVEAAARNAAWNGEFKEFIGLQDFKEGIKKIKASIGNEDLVYFNKLLKTFK